MADAKTLPTKRQIRTLRGLKRAPGGVVTRSSSIFLRQLIEPGWAKAKPLEDAEGFSTFTITDKGREALAEFQRGLRRALSEPIAERG